MTLDWLTIVDLPDEIEGAPCSVQVLGRTMREEELLRDAATIAAALVSTDDKDNS